MNRERVQAMIQVGASYLTYAIAEDLYRGSTSCVLKARMSARQLSTLRWLTSSECLVSSSKHASSSFSSSSSNKVSLRNILVISY